MSALNKFLTFEPMESAVVAAVSSEATGHPAEHAISPLEPNFAWQANQATTNHTLTIDLGYWRGVDGLMFIHHEAYDAGLPVDALTVEVAYSLNNSDWHTLTLWGSPDSSTVSDLDDTQIYKLRYFISPATSAIGTVRARFWRVTLKSTIPAAHPATDARISAAWLFSYNGLDVGHIVPRKDSIHFNASNAQLVNGKRFSSGHTVNAVTTLQRTWVVTETQLATVKAIIHKCNGQYRPMMYVDQSGNRYLCRIAEDTISIEKMASERYRIEMNLITVPTVKKDKVH